MSTPGEQSRAFNDASNGNLSDTTNGEIVGWTLGDRGIGDDVSNRTFSVDGSGSISYTGTHNWGVNADGVAVLQLFPYDDTNNNGGVYILGVCAVGATNASACKYDMFKVEDSVTDCPYGDCDVNPYGVINGMKYYDSNTNGQWDAGELGNENWLVNYRDGDSGSILTDSNGAFSVQLIEDSFAFCENQVPGWIQTGNRVNQTSASGSSFATLESDMTYSVNLYEGDEVSGIYFGNMCVGSSTGTGGHTMGYWSNSNGQKVMKGYDSYGASLANLRSLNLVRASGVAFDPTDYSGYRTWLLSATATNMSYMLSAQLSAMANNVRYGYVDGNQFIRAVGADGATAAGYMTVNALIAEANAALALYPITVSASDARSYLQDLKNAIDAGNNNRSVYVQPWPNATCADPATY